MDFSFNDAALRAREKLVDAEQKDDDKLSTALALVVFLEFDAACCTSPVDDAGGFERSTMMDRLASIANWLSKTFQPEPRMLHCELLLFPTVGGAFHHATYIGQAASWQAPDREYYGRGWRALVVPTKTPEDVDAIAEACKECNKAPYSFWRYLLSTRIGGLFASLFYDTPKSPAHCGGLVARVLKMSMPGVLSRVAPRYSPSLLYTDLCGATKTPLANAPAVHECADSINTLLRGSDESVRSLSHSERMRALCAYANQTLQDAQLNWNDMTKDETLYNQAIEKQRNTAWQAFRVSNAHAAERFANTQLMIPNVTDPDALEAATVPLQEGGHVTSSTQVGDGPREYDISKHAANATVSSTEAVHLLPE